MKYYPRFTMKIIAAIFCVVLFAGCKKGNSCDFNACVIQASTSEITDVKNYLTIHSITATQHCSGLFYSIDQPGTGNQPGPCSVVNVTYTATLTDGTVIDQATSPVSFDLSGLITAWRIGVPMLKEGGTMSLYVPPSLGYGSAARGSIPGNSILIFKLTLVSVQ